jgi:hypothetical protein
MRAISPDMSGKPLSSSLEILRAIAATRYITTQMVELIGIEPMT